MAAVAVGCLWGLVLLNILGPEGGGPEAPGGPARGGGCMTEEFAGPITRSDVTDEAEVRLSCKKHGGIVKQKHESNHEYHTFI